MKTIEISPLGAKLAYECLMGQRVVSADDLLAVDHLKRPLGKIVLESEEDYEPLKGIHPTDPKAIAVLDTLHSQERSFEIEDAPCAWMAEKLKTHPAPAAWGTVLRDTRAAFAKAGEPTEFIEE